MDAIGAAAGFLLQPTYWIVLLSVVLLAALASAIPGMNAFLVMALAFSYITFEVEDPAIGLVAIATISGVSNTLDSIPAILIGQPSAATQVTFLEGHQLARRGRAAHTLGAVYAVSALGGIIGAAILTAVIPIARPFVLSFGFPEIAATAMIGIVMVTVLGRGAMVKGLVAALVGMLLGMIGDFGRLTVDPFVPMPTIPFILGLFALPEMVDLMISRRPVAAEGAAVSRREVLSGARYGIAQWRMTVRQSAFGVLLGAIPGVGSAVVDWLSYAFGILLTKDKSGFGRGSLDGVLFAESAQNAKEAGAALPTLALGVPGAPDVGARRDGHDLVRHRAGPGDAREECPRHHPAGHHARPGQPRHHRHRTRPHRIPRPAHRDSLPHHRRDHHPHRTPLGVHRHHQLAGDTDRARRRRDGPGDEAVRLAAPADDSRLHPRARHRAQPLQQRQPVRLSGRTEPSADDRDTADRGGHRRGRWCVRSCGWSVGPAARPTARPDTATRAGAGGAGYRDRTCSYRSP